MIDRLFLQHPRSLGETYWQHMANAAGYGGALLLAGLACCIHALVPGWFTTTASRAVNRLGDRLMTRNVICQDVAPIGGPAK